VIVVGLLGYMLMSHVPFTDNFVIPWAAGRTWLLAGESPYGAICDRSLQQRLSKTHHLWQITGIACCFRSRSCQLILYAPFSLTSIYHQPHTLGDGVGA
jgi:hypothetical protein